MVSNIKKFALACATWLTFSSANAVVIEVNPGDPSWGSTPLDFNSNITTTFARDGNGSLELNGDRTRFYGLGNPWATTSNLGLLADVIDFSFEWAIAASSVSNLGPDYTPALRLHIFDGQQRSELIWEGAYNGTYGNTDRDTWYQTSFNDFFWRWEAGIGDSLVYNRTISDWAGVYSSNAYVSAISVGVGSSAGNDYVGFADNVTLQFRDQRSQTFNFEVRDVPAPASGLMMLGLALCAMRFKKRG